MQQKVRTPCIGVCSATSFGDRICRGCKRFGFEVINWNLYTEDEKQAVLNRVEALVIPLVEARFIIRSEDDLSAGLRRHSVPCNPDLSPAIWLHNLLKKRHGQLRDLADVGVEVRPEWQSMSLAALAEDLDVRLLALAEAHLLRYFPEYRGEGVPSSG